MNIIIKGDIRESSASVQASGDHVDTMTETEKSAFGWDDNVIKDTVARYFGKAPLDAFVNSDESNNVLKYDLYTMFNWKVTKVHFIPIKAEILGISAEPTLVSKVEFENNTDKKATYHADMSQTVTESTSHTWSQSNTLGVQLSIDCSMQLPGVKLGAENTLSYSHQWGENKSVTKSVEIGLQGGVSVELDPGEKATAKLSASLGKMKVRVTYKVYIDGSTAVHYDPPYAGHGSGKGHYFYAFDTPYLMYYNNLPYEKIVTEDIEISFYEDAYISLDQGGQEKNIFMSHIASAK